MRTCSTDGCNSKHYGRGLCKKHYLRAWSKGAHTEHPRAMVERGASLDTRLRHHGWTVTEDGCWEWAGYRDPSGYGRLAAGRSVPILASRAAYLAWVGELPGGVDVCHHCDNPPCINPEHLFIGSRQDNVDDMVAKRRQCNGENKSLHKLTDAQVDEIRCRYTAGGISQQALAVEYGICQQLVSHLVRGTRRGQPTIRSAPSS